MNKLKVNPQIIILFDQNGDAQKTIFLSYEEIDKNSYVYGFYFLSKEFIHYETEYEVVQDHIPLTYNLSEVRGHISNLLDFSDKIVVYSPYNNIDYSYHNADVFNPFKIINETSIKTNSDSEILYNVYKNKLTNGAIFCVVKGKDLNIKSLGRFGMYMESKRKIIYNIIKNIYENDYLTTYEIKNTADYEVECSIDLLLKLIRIEKYNKTLYWNYKSKNDIYLGGNKLSIFDNLEKEYNKILKFEDQDREIFSIYDNSLRIRDNKIFNEIIENFKNYLLIKDKKKKVTIIIHFDIYLNTNINFDFDFNFFVELKKGTQNIFSDRTGNIQIIISKDHISYRSSNTDILLAEYFTAFFLGYSHITNKMKGNRTDVKINQLYTSRYCQNTKTSERKPRITDIENINFDDYIKFNEKFYEGKVINNVKQGDLYVDKTGICYKCFDKNYPYLSFVSNFAYSTSILEEVPCIPCCFSKNKRETEVFSRCITGSINREIDEDQSNYIQNYGRIITNKRKNTFLPSDINIILNTGYDVNYNIHKKIIFANNFSIIRKYEENLDPIENFTDLYNLSKKFDCIIIEENNIFINPDTLNKYFEKDIDLKIFILIQKRVHIVKNISKDKSDNRIIIKDLNNEKIKNLIETYFKRFYKHKIIKSDPKNNIILTNNKFLYENKQISLKNNTTLFKIPNVKIEKTSTSEIIYEYYKDIYFKYIYSDKKDNIVKSFILNTHLNINEENKLNDKATTELIIKKLDSLN